MRKRNFALNIGIGFSIFFASWLFFHGMLMFPASAGGLPEYKFALKTFRPFTVEVSFEQDALDSVLGYDENELSDVVLKEISSRAEKSFGKAVSFSRYGKPYSFQTNPLNLAITFNIIKYTYDPKKFNILVTFERTRFFSLLETSNYSAKQKEKYLELLNSSTQDFVKPTYSTYLSQGPKGHATHFTSEGELFTRIGFLSDIIVADMKPDDEIAAKAEEDLKKR